MDDPLYDKALQVVKAANPPSITNIQRTLLIGYNRARRLMDAMIEDGTVRTIELPNGVGYRLNRE